jgi:hypothetical protein
LLHIIVVLHRLNQASLNYISKFSQNIYKTSQKAMAGKTDKLSTTETLEVTAGATGAVYAINEIFKTLDPEDKDTTEHLVKGGIGAAVAIGAWELIRRREAGEVGIDHGYQGPHNGYPIRSVRYRSRSRSISPSRSRGSRSRSSSSHIKHHGRHLAEEIVGAYALGKELLGDRRHHVGHLVGEALGATGFVQDLRARDKLDEEERKRENHEVKRITVHGHQNWE